MLYQRQSISADELATEFGVSKITIRRDLDALAGDKFLERTRGGAVSIAGLRLEERQGRPPGGVEDAEDQVRVVGLDQLHEI